MTSSVPQIESEKQTLREGVTEAELWLRKIKRAQDDEDKWRQDAKKAIEIYEAEDKQNIHFNILNSNVETLLPSVYNSTPVPDVRRRFGDADPVAKMVVDVQERMLSYSVDQYDFDEEFEMVIRDSLVAGRGVARIRYEPKTEGESVTYQAVKCERVPWDKFIRGPARSWAKVPWVAFEHDMTKDQLKQHFKEKGAAVALAGEAKNVDGDKDDSTGILNTAKVYEIWDRNSRKVLFVAKDHTTEVLKKDDDVLDLPDFFPCLKPLQSIKRPSSLVPVCPYKVIEKLVNELDVVTKRISALVKQLRVRGLYYSDMEGDFESVKDLEDGQFMASKNAAAFAAGAGGLDKAVWVWPMEPTVKALQQLYQQRDQIKATIYEVTGISDIIRGASDANETATAQQIKTQWGSLRVQNMQKAVARMARDVFRAKVAIFSRHFEPQMISLMTSLPNQQDQEQMQIWPVAMQLFKSEAMTFRIDIETDSTIRADMTRNQQQMTEFLTGTGQFAQAVSGLVQGMPQYAQQALPVLVEVYTAFARKFKLGKQAEDALDSLSSIAQQLKQNPQPEKPDPAAQKAEAEMQTMQAKAQLDQQSQQAKLQFDAQAKQQEMQHKERMAQLDERIAMLNLNMKQAELDLKKQEAALTMQAKFQEMAMRQDEMAMDRQSRSEEIEAQREGRMMDREDRMEQQEMDHEDREADREHMQETNAIKVQGMKEQAKAKAMQAKQRPEARS